MAFSNDGVPYVYWRPAQGQPAGSRAEPGIPVALGLLPVEPCPPDPPTTYRSTVHPCLRPRQGGAPTVGVNPPGSVRTLPSARERSAYGIRTVTISFPYGGRSFCCSTRQQHL